MHADMCNRLLAAMPATLNELTAATSVSKSSVKHWTLMLRRAGWAHVGGWRRSGGGEPGAGGKQQPIIHAGPGRDRPKPAKFDRAANLARYYTKARREGTYEFKLSRELARRRADRAASRGRAASPFDALFR